MNGDTGKPVSVLNDTLLNHGIEPVIWSSSTALPLLISDVANVNNPPTGTVSISGSPTQGETLTASNTLQDLDGIPSSGTGAIQFQWLTDEVEIDGATGSTIVLTQAQVGKSISVRASYVDNFGTAESVTSAGTEAVANVNDILPDTRPGDPTIFNLAIADRNGREMEGVALIDEDQANLTTTDASGIATFAMAPGSEVSGAVFLEFTTGRPITAQDALEALRLAVGLNPTYDEADAYAFIAADFNQDGRVTAQDALEILRHAVRLPDAIQTEWIFVDSDQDFLTSTEEM